MTPPAQDFGAWVPGPRAHRGPTGSGPLAGLRLAVKDLIDVQGAPTTGGNPDWAATHAPAASDAWAVARLRAAGAQVMGKTVTDELAFSLEGENAHHGTPVNPRAPGRLPGGSSSGSAVAVAAGLADLALGTDTGGSVRVPASFCGVWAMRPTHGRVPLDGVLPFAPSYDTVGWFARDADLLALAGLVLLGGNPGPADRQARAHAGSATHVADPAGPGAADAARTKPLTLRVATDALAIADAPVAAALQALAARLGCGSTLWAFEGFTRNDCLQAYATLQGLEIAATLGPWIRSAQPRFGPSIAPRFEGALALDPAGGASWRGWRARMARSLAARLGPDEAWLVPAAPGVALPRGTAEAAVSDFYARALALGALAGHAGLPQVVMPLATVDGMPVGLSFIAAPGNDERLLALARRCALQLQGAAP